jgi:hypothetical protein
VSGPDELTGQLVDATRALVGRLTELNEYTRGNILNHVLHTRTHIVGAQGWLQVDFGVEGAAVSVHAVATAGTIVVVAGPANTATAPTVGKGIRRLRPGDAATFPVKTNVVTIWGQPGDEVYLGVFTRPQPPTASVGKPPVTPVTVGGASALVVAFPCIYRGFSFRETAGAPATIEIRDGSAAGQILDEITLTATESARELYESGSVASVGIFYQLVAGTVAGIVRRSGG